jgi:uroporphyrinogen-III synthase
VSTRPRLIVTRPVKEAQAWVADLRGLGFDAVALPLITICPVTEIAALSEAWRSLASFDAVMFVSGNAVSHFFDQRPVALSNPFADAGATPRAWVTGPASRGALLACGVPTGVIDCPSSDSGQFDSEALWRLVRHRVVPGYRVLVVRGRAERAEPSPQGVGRDWFAQQIEAAGGSVTFVVAYERRAPVWDPAQGEWVAKAARDGSVWLFSSAEALGYLAQCAPRQSWAQARAIATHPRIAEAARKAGFGRVQESRPLLPEVVASIESGT